MNARLEKLAEFVVGTRDLATVCARTVFGVVAPAIGLGYGIRCVVTRHAMIIGRGPLEMVGLSAVAGGAAYILASVAAYVYICWDDHTKFAGLRDFTLQLLLIGVAILYAASISLALI
ncbi:MAG TPA: hypothetical protein VH107_10565 [Lacipirellulaceae bacterium]|jgi:hypothetical protein|nr:hypothetical protein [Lacipirellulaceae bacterium]